MSGGPSWETLTVAQTVIITIIAPASDLFKTSNIFSFSPTRAIAVLTLFAGRVYTVIESSAEQMGPL